MMSGWRTAQDSNLRRFRGILGREELRRPEQARLRASYGATAFAFQMACRAEACAAGEGWWAVQDSNLRPPACEAGALTN